MPVNAANQIQNANISANQKSNTPPLAPQVKLFSEKLESNNSKNTLQKAADHTGLSQLANDDDSWHTLMGQTFGYDHSDSNGDAYTESETLRQHVLDGNWEGLDIDMVYVESDQTFEAAFVGGDTADTSDDQILVGRNASGEAIIEEVFHAFERKINADQEGDTRLVDQTITFTNDEGASALDEGELGVTLLREFNKTGSVPSDSSEFLGEGEITQNDTNIVTLNGTPVSAEFTYSADPDIQAEIDLAIENWHSYIDYSEVEVEVDGEVVVTNSAPYIMDANLFLGMEPLGGDEATRFVDPQRAAQVLRDYWGDYGEGGSVNINEIEQSLGLAPNTANVTVVADGNGLVRGALAYVLDNPAVFNALDVASGAADGSFTLDDVEAFYDNSVNTGLELSDWYDGLDNSNPLDEVKNKQFYALMYQHALLDTASGAANKNGAFNGEDLAVFADSDDPIMKEATSFMGNDAIRLRTDTGGLMFAWWNRPDGQIAYDDLMTSSGAVSLDLDDIESTVMMSLLVRAYSQTDPDVAISDAVKDKIGNILMAYDGKELLASDPDGIIKDGSAESLGVKMDEIIAEALGDPDTSAWVEANLPDELDRWLPVGSTTRTTLEEQVIALRGATDDDEIEALATQIMEDNPNDYFGAMSDLITYVSPLKVFAPDQYEDVSLFAGNVLTDAYAAGVEADEEVEQEAIDQAIGYLPDEVQAEFTDAEHYQNYTDAMSIMKRYAALGKNIPQMISSWSKFSDTVGDFSQFGSPTLATWKDLYSKGYMHGASAAVTTAGLVTNILTTDGPQEPEDIAKYVAVTLSLAADVSSGIGTSMLKTGTEALNGSDTMIPDISKSTLSKLSTGSKLAFYGSMFLGGAGAINSVLNGLSAEEAFENGDYVGGTLFALDSAAGGLTAAGMAIKVLGTGSASLAAFGTGLAAAGGLVGGGVLLGTIIYSMVQNAEYLDDMREYRVEAEQVFRPSVVNDGATSYNEGQLQAWWEGVYSGGDRLGFDDGSSDLDHIFNVAHPAGSVDEDGEIGVGS